MKFDIITIFPNLFDSFLSESLIKKSTEKRLNKFCVHDLRKWTNDKHKTTDDRPYSGGAGMVMMAEPILKALKNICRDAPRRVSTKDANHKKKSKIILLSPSGKQFNQKMAEKLSRFDQLILICGRYEGVDARVEKFIDQKISVGPYVLSGGELAAMVVIESVARLIPGYLGNPNSLCEESFNQGRIEYPQYTRPEVLEVSGHKLRVPKVLLSGDHKKIGEWRTSHRKTQKTQNL